MISICIPTRKRPEVFKQACSSVLATAEKPDEIEFVSYQDDDDDSVYEHIGNFKHIVGPRVGPHISANECQKAATGDIYMFMPDDMLIEDFGWDTKVKEAYDLYPDKILFVHFNDHRRRSSFGNLGCLHKNWIDVVGYGMRPDIFRRGDCWINDVSRKLERRFFIRSIGVKNIDIREDETHKDFIAKSESSKCVEIYKSEAMYLEREKDVQLLQNFINNFK